MLKRLLVMHCVLCSKNIYFNRNASGVSDVQADTMEVVNSPPECEITMVKSSPARTYGNIVFKGRNSYTKTPEKGASSVVYPFGFTKPFSVRGDMTLKEINKKIHTPPPSKSKQRNQDPPSYPTSAFSGKPVFGKRKFTQRAEEEALQS